MTASNFQTKILRRKTSPDEYRVYRAGLEWDLTDPIVIEKREDLKSEYLWHDRMEPYHHQVTNLITFCRRLPVTLLADDVGLGKTISAGLIISELISRSRLSKILIVCPKLLGPQWQEELLTKFNISSEIATGKKLITADPEETGAVITTYQSARQYLDLIPNDRFQMLILDEAHKLRNLYGVANPPMVAKRFRKALEERRFRFVLMLTATPIQNRLWDLYSLVDLLTVARGHKNPFGTEGIFARKFIADGRDQARHLKDEAREEFRSIVYGYMSRVRRGDAKLYFPDRVVQMHKVVPTSAELQLIETIAKPLQKLNRLAQISILQALTSSPEALMAQLNNMARNATVPNDLATAVRAIVTTMPTSTKLNGLGKLIDQLKEKKPEQWRLVVFTGRIETQTTIHNFLESRGLKVGIINGSSGTRNQETIARFKKNPPDLHVIVSTEAGSEGINLQVANILVNYDLPWNPMIIEQRIGRVQRLASEHKNVGIFNIVLSGTFEEYIVGRLMEKLQMASSAIGDIESLLEASGISGDDENEATSFDEKIRQLVMEALTGKDVEESVRLQEQSIIDAKNALKLEEESINSMLGGMDGAEYVGPRAPNLPTVVRSMQPDDFTLSALRTFGAHVTQQGPDQYLVEQNGGNEYIRFNEKETVPTIRKYTLYAPGTSSFHQLISRVIATGIHEIEDLDNNPEKVIEEISSQWVSSFSGKLQSIEIKNIQRCFEGVAIVRVRATVAHDSYERLVEVHCTPAEHFIQTNQSGLERLPSVIENPNFIGLNSDRLIDAAKLDDAISEFCRFYLERRTQEMQLAYGDDRKQKKLEDDFTPRLEMTLVGLEGNLFRRLNVTAEYKLDTDFRYTSSFTVIAFNKEIIDKPEFKTCEQSGKIAPQDCLSKCQISGKFILQHLLVKSEVSKRLALPEFTIVCSQSGKRVLKDEARLSDVSGRFSENSLLKVSPISGKYAEPEYFGQCEITKSDVLSTELFISDLSNKRYRIDEQARSSVSGKTGHRQEFIICSQTMQLMAPNEAEKCDITGKYVVPGILESCSVSQKRVLPSELSQCTVTGKRALKKFLVSSSLTGALLLEEVAVRSAMGRFCTPIEAKPCNWSGNKFHPDDIRICLLTGIPIHFQFCTDTNNPRLAPLVELLNGIKRTSDESRLWSDVSVKMTAVIGKGRCHVESAVLSPDKKHLAICSEVRTLLGFRVQQAGLVYALTDQSVIGRVTLGRRNTQGWFETKLS